MKAFGLEVSLTEVSDTITYGYTASATDENTGVKFVRITDIVPDRINWETVPFCPISEKDAEKYKLNIGDIIVARTGATTGWNKTIKKLSHKAVYASFLIKYSVNYSIADPYYVGYNLQSPNWYEYVDAIAGGSAQPGANAKQLGSFKFLLPTLAEQKTIASVLSSLDDKIDLLHRQNKTLEEMAETLFRQWFIEEAKEDWDEVTLADVCTRITDGSHSSPASVENGYPMASVKDMSDWGINETTCRKISKDDYEDLVKADCKALGGDILIAKDGSYLKHVFLLEESLDIVLLSSIAMLRPNGLYNSMLLTLFLKLDSTHELMQNIVTGAVIPRIVLKDFRKFPIQLPPKELQDKAIEFIKPLFQKCWKNNKQIQTLEKLRDTLLPKLMSGEVRVEYKKVDAA